MQKFIIKIDSATLSNLENLNEECYLLNANLDKDFCEEAVKVLKEKDKIVLFYGDNAVASAKEFEVDGVLLELEFVNLKEQLKIIRKDLGKHSIVGLFTRNRRHESMLVSEAEPDFIVFKVWKDGFENVRELTEWYADFFLIQSAGYLMEDGVDCSLLKTDMIIK